MSATQIDHLVKMANQIALNLAAGKDEEAVAKATGEHITRFWTPAMRAQLREFWRDGGEGLAPAVTAYLESSAVGTQTQ